MTNTVLGLIDSFRTMKVLVIGDPMLDVYLEGQVLRVCREAPVPIVDVTRVKRAAGGAANTAANIRSMGGRVAFLGVIGDDAEGRLLCRALEACGVGVGDLIVQAARSSLVKNRVIASSQIVMRFDQGTTGPIDRSIEDELLRRLSGLFPSVDAVIVSDYGYGLISRRIIETLGALQSSAPRTLVVDSKQLSDYRSLRVTSVKPNLDETLRLLGLSANATPEEILSHGQRILELTGSRIAAVTLDSKGALFFERGSAPYRTYAHPVQHARAIGAGDTFVSALTLCLALEAPTAIAAEIASAAAAVVVAKEGTTTCGRQELRDYFCTGGKCIGSLDSLAERIRLYKRQGLRIVFTNGCFDIIHSGHIGYLNQAKAMGDVLVVGINSDGSVRRLKGPERPINSLEDRIRVLTALSCVDHIVAFEEDTPEEVIKAVRPDIFTKGGDYTPATLPEAPLVRDLGGRIQILPYLENFSTTDIIDRIRQGGEDTGAR